MKSSSTPDLYAGVTQQIITALESGTALWVCPWDRSGCGSALPANLSTGRPYRGINVLLLNLQAMAQGYALNRWITFQQARALGGHVRRGETGAPSSFSRCWRLKAMRVHLALCRGARVRPTMRLLAV